jgi:HAD superfamily hydrolase (TIGR01509 family)
VIEGVVFDADGTLLASTSMWMEAGLRYLQTLGIITDTSLGEKMFSMTLADSAQYLRTTYQIDRSNEEIARGINQTIQSFYQNEVTLKQGAKEFLESLYKKNIPITLATATDRELIESGLRHTGILHYFEQIFTCGEVEAGKDRPDIYLHARECMGSKLEKTWVFEDAVHAAKTARMAGFMVAGVYDPISHDHQDALRSLSHIYLSDLCQFDFFYHQATGNSNLDKTN